MNARERSCKAEITSRFSMLWALQDLQPWFQARKTTAITYGCWRTLEMTRASRLPQARSSSPGKLGIAEEQEDLLNGRPAGAVRP